MKKFFSLLLLIGFASCHAMHLEKYHYHAPERLGDIAISYNDGFAIEKENKKIKVDKVWTDKILHNMSAQTLAKYLAHDNYLVVDQMSDGKYCIKGKTRGKGGGPWLASVFYSTVKAACYGSFAAAGTAAVVGVAVAAAPAGAATAVAAGVNMAATAIAAGTAPAVAIGAGGLTMGAGSAVVAAGAACSTGVMAAATTGTLTAVAATGGSIAGMVALVETASLAAGAVGMWIPFL